MGAGVEVWQDGCVGVDLDAACFKILRGVHRARLLATVRSLECRASKGLSLDAVTKKSHYIYIEGNQRPHSDQRTSETRVTLLPFSDRQFIRTFYPNQHYVRSRLGSSCLQLAIGKPRSSNPSRDKTAAQKARITDVFVRVCRQYAWFI